MGSITPGIVGIGVYLHHQSVKVQIKGFLCSFRQNIASAANMGYIANNLQSGELLHQINSHLPAGQISVFAIAISRETAVDSSNPSDSGFIEAFDGANPEFIVRIDRIFNNNRHVSACECIGNFLYRKRIDSSSCANPQHVNIMKQAIVDVLSRCHLGCNRQTSFRFDTFEPREAGSANTLESAWSGTGLPYTSPEKRDMLVFQRKRSRNDLFFRFSRTGACNEYRPSIRFKNGFKVHIEHIEGAKFGYCAR